MTNPVTKKPETLEELLDDRNSHPNRGKINGKPVVKSGSTELRGKIPKPLYDQMIYITRAFSLGKGDAARGGALDVIEKICVHEAGEDFLRWQTIQYDGPYRLFRGNIPSGLYESIAAIFDEKGYPINDMATIVVSCFVSRYKIALQKRIQQLQKEFNTTPEEIEKAFAGDAKQLARDKKIEILQNAGKLSDIDIEKMD
jgi:hypothetical protein